MMTTEEQTEAKPAAVAGEVKKWTVVAGDPPGKIQVKRINDAWNGLKSEHNHYVEVNGIVGVSEDRTAFYSPFGGGSRSEVTEAMIRVGERFNWQASRANATAIVAAILAELPALKESRPVKDERRTPEQEAESVAKAAAWQAEQSKEAAETAAACQKAKGEAQAAYPWADQNGSEWARGARNLKALLQRTFPGVTFSTSSDYGQIRAEWTDGPTWTEVRTIGERFSDRDFDGMQDMEVLDRDGGREGFRAWMGHAKYFSPTRHYSTEIELAVARAVCAAQHVELAADAYDPERGDSGPTLPGLGTTLREEVRKIMERTAIPAGAKFEALGFQDGTGFVPVFSVGVPPAVTDGPAPTVSPTGVTIQHNQEHNGVEIRFPGKPAASVLTELKAAGFRWSRFSQVWYKKYGAYSWAQAHRIAGIELPADGGPGRNEGEDPAGAMVQANEEAGQDQIARDIGA